MVHGIVIAVIIVALVLMGYNYYRISIMNEGTAEMSDLAKIIRDGANVFMAREYRVIVIVVLIVAAVLSVFIERLSGVTFIVGACMSSAACVLGMKSATYANVRTANRARETGSIGETVKVALCGGSVSGLSVHAFGLLGLTLILIVLGWVQPDATSTGFIPVFATNPTVIRLTSYSLGCSLVAMFNRVAGGNYTKGADISADIVAKNRHDMPEDDSRMPNTIADFIGDNVNDIAGNCSDLLESFVATIVASMLIAQLFSSSPALMSAASVFPLLIAAGGLFSCVLGILYASLHKAGDNPAKELDICTYISAAGSIIVSIIAARILFGGIESPDSFAAGWISPWLASVFGILSGVAVGKITEYYTSTDHRPVQGLAKFSVEGEAFVVTKGDAIGSRSVLLPEAVIAISIILSGLLCGFYGVAIAALGMLSFVATTVSIDAFGPIADNAGGIAESCHLPESVRSITDKLDAVGNTTAAIGKGFAIGSAAFATVSLIFSYVGSYTSGGTEAMLNIASVSVIAGAIIGGGLVEYFCALLTDNTIESAYLMAEEGDRQLSIPGVMEGTVRPDYNKVIEMATGQALRKMLLPSVLALIVPVICGLLFGPDFFGGVLIGATVVAIPRAIFMGNSGGAFDNAKKYVESGLLEGHGKGSAAHKATVVGDTVGDTRKDVVGVALDIFIKTMSTVGNTLAPVFANFHLF